MSLAIVELTQKNKTSSACLARLAELMTWYQTNDKVGVSLKELKQHFPDWTTLTMDIEELVSKSYLKRTKRMYTVNLPERSEADLAALAQEGKVRAAACQEQLSALTMDAVEQSWLCALWIGAEKGNLSGAFWTEGGEDPTEVPLYSWQSDSFVYCEQGTGPDLGLASYFSTAPQTALALSTRQLIGDVNPQYFLTMTSQVLQSIAAGKQLKKMSRTIFGQTLLAYDYIQIEPDTVTVKASLATLAAEVFQQRQVDLGEAFKPFIPNSQSELLNDQLLRFYIMRELCQSLNFQQGVLQLASEQDA